MPEWHKISWIQLVHNLIKIKITILIDFKHGKVCFFNKTTKQPKGTYGSHQKWYSKVLKYMEIAYLGRFAIF